MLIKSLGGFKWSSQHIACWLIITTGQMPLPVFSKQASCGAGRWWDRTFRQRSLAVVRVQRTSAPSSLTRSSIWRPQAGCWGSGVNFPTTSRPGLTARRLRPRLAQVWTFGRCCTVHLIPLAAGSGSKARSQPVVIKDGQSAKTAEQGRALVASISRTSELNGSKRHVLKVESSVS